MGVLLGVKVSVAVEVKLGVRVILGVLVNVRVRVLVRDGVAVFVRLGTTFTTLVGVLTAVFTVAAQTSGFFQETLGLIKLNTKIKTNSFFNTISLLS